MLLREALFAQANSLEIIYSDLILIRKTIQILSNIFLIKNILITFRLSFINVVLAKVPKLFEI